MREITLKKAAQLVAAIQERLAKTSHIPVNVTISIYDAASETELAERVDGLRKDFDKDLSTATRAISALYDLRARIATANAACGINDILTQRAGLEALEKLLARIVAGGDLGPRVLASDDIAQVAASLERRREGIKGRSAGWDETDVEIRAIRETTLAEIADRLAMTRLRRSELGDELAALNTTMRVALDGDTFAFLVEEKFISA